MHRCAVLLLPPGQPSLRSAGWFSHLAFLPPRPVLQLPQLEQGLLLSLLPKDSADERGVVVEVRAGTGGDEACLFAMDLFRMYERYAELRGWRFEVRAGRPAARPGGCLGWLGLARCRCEAEALSVGLQRNVWHCIDKPAAWTIQQTSSWPLYPGCGPQQSTLPVLWPLAPHLPLLCCALAAQAPAAHGARVPPAEPPKSRCAALCCAQVVEMSETDMGGCKLASATIAGHGAYGRLKFESGIHRVQVRCGFSSATPLSSIQNPVQFVQFSG